MAHNKCHIYSLYWAASSFPSAAACGEFAPIFNPDAESPNYGLLSAGVLESSYGTVTDYVIEWHLNARDGEIVFTSGTTNTPPEFSLDDTHPFENQPVEAGTLYPVILYVIIDNKTYKSSVSVPIDGSVSTDLVDCLDSVAIYRPSCDNGDIGTYAHTITYDWEKAEEGENSSRTIEFELDNTTNYVAYYFDGDLIADEVKMYYVSGETETLVKDVIAGADATKVGVYNDIFYWKASYDLRGVIDVSGFTYTTGDYIKFDITGSVEVPTELRTIWTLKFTCLESLSFVDGGCSVIDSDFNKVEECSVYTSYNTTNCRLYVFFDRVGSTTLDSDFNTYLSSYPIFGNIGGTGGQAAMFNTPFYLYVNVGTTANYTQSSGSGSQGRYPTNAPIHLTSTKQTSSTSLLRLDFEDSDDYDDWETYYYAVKTVIELTYDPDDTTMEHYQGYKIGQYETCADGAASSNFGWQYGSPITFTPGGGAYSQGRIEVTATVPTNEFDSLPTCTNGQIYNAINNYISLMQSYVDNDQTFTYECGGGSIGFGRYYITATASQGYRQIIWHKRISDYLMECTPSEPEFCHWDDYDTSDGDDSRYDMIEGYRVTVTDLDDPEGNFELYSYGDAETCTTEISGTPKFPDDFVLVYKINNWIVEVPVSGCP